MLRTPSAHTHGIYSAQTLWTNLFFITTLTAALLLCEDGEL